MKVIKYFIFLIFNNFYRDGNHKENDMPHVTAAGCLMLYEWCVLLIGTFFLNKYIDLTFIANVLKPLDDIVYGWGMIMCISMYPINHYYFIKKRLFDRIYDEFKNDKINTKKN